MDVSPRKSASVLTLHLHTEAAKINIYSWNNTSMQNNPFSVDSRCFERYELVLTAAKA